MSYDTLSDKVFLISNRLSDKGWVYEGTIPHYHEGNTKPYEEYIKNLKVSGFNVTKIFDHSSEDGQVYFHIFVKPAPKGEEPKTVRLGDLFPASSCAG